MNFLDPERENAYFRADVHRNSTGCPEQRGSCSSYRRRGRLSKLTNIFDKNPRLETVVGFSFARNRPAELK